MKTRSFRYPLIAAARRPGVAMADQGKIIPWINRRNIAAEKAKYGDSAYGGGAPLWPEAVKASGAAATFARTYADYLEPPEPFFFMSYLSMLGHMVSDRISIASELYEPPRLYTVLLGESADARKSTAINKTASFYRECLEPGATNQIMGVGSAEGFGKTFKTNHRGILIVDEFQALIQKMRIKNSTLLQAINTLFHLDYYHNETSEKSLKIDNAHLSILAASTLDTYQNMFSATFMNIGFLNRVFVVVADGQKKHSIPKPMPDHEKQKLKNDLADILRFADDLTRHAGLYRFPISKSARDIYDVWYFSSEKSIFARRLDTYGLRLMPLLAMNEMKSEITFEVMEKVIALLDYQLSARKHADPIDADNRVAKLEMMIRRRLDAGSMDDRTLKRSCNYDKYGIWIFKQALKNLHEAGEIAFDKEKKTWKRILS